MCPRNGATMRQSTKLCISATEKYWNEKRITFFFQSKKNPRSTFHQMSPTVIQHVHRVQYTKSSLFPKSAVSISDVTWRRRAWNPNWRQIFQREEWLLQQLLLPVSAAAASQLSDGTAAALVNKRVLFYFLNKGKHFWNTSASERREELFLVFWRHVRGGFTLVIVR